MEKAVLKIKKASPDVNPYAVASSTLQASGSLKKGTNEATKAGVKRGRKSSAWREQHPPSKAGGKIEGAAKKPHLGRTR
jgi:hypothetical protein